MMAIKTCLAQLHDEDNHKHSYLNLKMCGEHTEVSWLEDTLQKNCYFIVVIDEPWSCLNIRKGGTSDQKGRPSNMEGGILH